MNQSLVTIIKPLIGENEEIIKILTAIVKKTNTRKFT